MPRGVIIRVKAASPTKKSYFIMITRRSARLAARRGPAERDLWRIYHGARRYSAHCLRTRRGGESVN
ncbi:hypothetical protein EVAR_102760_1 [Eumeta japonica]|uniref:Uncharacterized protein n=1 Tax=Eumeta variegata TaxID=151549 RepID=A0A4C1TL90_EUMVA|nr:hypothetical protein EVAR_102760_1 [Eumeta japonica]